MLRSLMPPTLRHQDAAVPAKRSRLHGMHVCNTCSRSTLPHAKHTLVDGHGMLVAPRPWLSSSPHASSGHARSHHHLRGGRGNARMRPATRRGFAGAVQPRHDDAGARGAARDAAGRARPQAGRTYDRREPQRRPRGRRAAARNPAGRNLHPRGPRRYHRRQRGAVGLRYSCAPCMGPASLASRS